MYENDNKIGPLKQITAGCTITHLFLVFVFQDTQTITHVKCMSATPSTKDGVAQTPTSTSRMSKYVPDNTKDTEII